MCRRLRRQLQRVAHSCSCSLLVLSLFLSFTEASIRRVSPFELTINSGAIRGERLIIKGEDYTVFKGIPYARPPVGVQRFQQPKETAKWRGVMNATQYSALCVQRLGERPNDPERHSAHFSEDCLYLNVFSPTPYQYTNDTYPVIVLIHGGDFQYGGGSDFPQSAILDNFVSRKVVFVTFNYRLGPLGFLSTGDHELPGNIGLWDQIWALKWVKANAEVFGGDAGNILLMGEGSGAASASLLALSPKTEGLFHKVLLMSGSALQPGVVRDTVANVTWSLAEKMHCRSFNSSELLKCFSKHTREELLDFNRVHFDDYEEFVPVVDGVGGVIPDFPEELAKHRRKIPIMIGTTRDESALRMLILNEKSVNFSALSSDVAELLADNMTMSSAQFQNHRLIAQACKAEYVWSKVDPAMPENVLFDSILQMYSHFWFDAPAARLATYYSKKAPVFLYSFDHVSENFYDYDKAFHNVDKLHLFNITPRFLSRRRDMNWQLDQRVVEIFAELIVNFARHGHPTPEGAGFSFNWTQTHPDELNYLSITDSPSMQVGYRWQGHVFWNWYARTLDAVDVGNLQRIAQLDRDVGNWQFATAILAFCALFFFAILVGLACYCTRKDSDEDEL